MIFEYFRGGWGWSTAAQAQVIKRMPSGSIVEAATPHPGHPPICCCPLASWWVFTFETFDMCTLYNVHCTCFNLCVQVLTFETYAVPLFSNGSSPKPGTHEMLSKHEPQISKPQASSNKNLVPTWPISTKDSLSVPGQFWWFHIELS